MRILGIETSCDETSLARVEASGGLRNPQFRVLKNLVSSQVKIHAPFGGVVPNLAKREHLKNLPILFKQLKAKSLRLKAIDLIAVTVGPGLEPALWTGITFAQELREKLKFQNSNIKLIGANHLEGHLYSFLLGKNPNLKPIRQRRIRLRRKTFNLFPAISLIVSGGHTILLLMKNLAHWEKLGETRDDAVGEAFDKVARILGLPYPGGPEIERIARSGNPRAVEFPRPMLHQKNYDFSFSGLKTSVLYYLQEHGSRMHAENGADTRGYYISANRPRNPRISAARADVAASFQAAAIDILVQKTMRAAREFNAKSIMLSGGVAANQALRAALRREAKKLGCAFFAPAAAYNTDNAAMIAVAGYLAYLRKKKYKIIANGNLSM